ncbi:MAG: hypothetical protein NTZ35_00560 [Ignavibacteriales bacterium]|nr:hypothetical protein [Ignavibacteriales bacterium]
MPKYGYIVVEGPHDVEFAYRLLRPFHLSRVQLEADLDPFFEPLIPRKYPPDGDLQKRMTTPLFLQSDTHAVAIHSAIGDTRLIQTVEENADRIDMTQVTGIGIILDSDNAIIAADRYAIIKEGMQAKGFALPQAAGTVAAGPPKLGAFVLPDNHNAGTLESLLIECAQQVYPNLLQSAITHVNSVSADGTLMADDLEDFNKPAGRNKAVVGTIASILRPGKSVQVSLQDNRWLRDAALNIARVKAVQDFLVSLLELA